MPYITERWPGGMLTNFATIRKSLKKLSQIEKLMKDDAFNNIAKHAEAETVSVQLDCQGDRAKIVIQDDGIGFDPEAAGGSGHGLGNLRRRASRLSGSLEIDSAPGRGTEVIFEAPFSN